MNIRNDRTVFNVGPAPANFLDLKGCLCLLNSATYSSINLAKKANGLNARTLGRNEKLPPTVQEANRDIHSQS